MYLTYTYIPMKMTVLAILIAATIAWAFTMGYQVGYIRAVRLISDEVDLLLESHENEINELLKEYLDQDCDTDVEQMPLHRPLTT